MPYFKNSENTCTFIGHIGKDVVAGTNSKSTRFSIATTLSLGKDRSPSEKTIWVPLEIWNDHPAFSFLKKGKMIYVVGYYDTYDYMDGETKRYFHSFKVTELKLLDKKEQEKAS